MTEKTRLFLLGAPHAQQAYADEFVSAAGGRDARMAVLVQTRAGWEQHKAGVTQPWLDRGVSRFTPVMPGENGSLDIEAARLSLQDATGILICGGNTALNYKLFSSEPIRSLLRQRYQAGIPVAGISAGALVALEICPLLPQETGSNDIQIVPGLELAWGFVIGVHFTEWNTLPVVLDVMSRTRTSTAYGIDEPACAVFVERKLLHVLGRSVYKIEMEDFEKKTHRLTSLN